MINILILPAAEILLSKDEIDWIYIKPYQETKKVIADAIEFAVNHPETYVGILIGGYDDNIDYIIDNEEDGNLSSRHIPARSFP
jgi:hypothetical protein